MENLDAVSSELEVVKVGLLLEKYKLKSKDPVYRGYSPLFCAVDDRELGDVNDLLAHYEKIGTLPQELAFVSPSQETHENILHVAMSSPAILASCILRLKQINPQLIETHLLQPDADGDTFLHQVVEFGRKESLALLKDDPTLHDILQHALTIENNKGETPLSMAEDYEGSPTIQKLIKDAGPLRGETLKQAIENAVDILEMFNEISPRASARP